MAWRGKVSRMGCTLICECRSRRVKLEVEVDQNLNTTFLLLL